MAKPPPSATIQSHPSQRGPAPGDSAGRFVGFGNYRFRTGTSPKSGWFLATHHHLAMNNAPPAAAGFNPVTIIPRKAQ